MVKSLVFMMGCLLGGAATWAQLPPVPDSTGEKVPRPLLFVPQRVADIGEVLEGDKRTVTWRLENRGDAELIITRTSAACGCTIVKLEEKDKVIAPGGTLDFKTEFDSTGRRGKQSKIVIVETNDLAEPKLTLTFTAEVKVIFEVRPPGLVNLGTVRRGESTSKQVEFRPTDKSGSIEILDISLSEHSPLLLRSEPFAVGDGTGQRIVATIGEDTAMGPLTTRATVKLSVNGIVRTRDLTLRGQVVGDLSWHPTVVDTTRQAARPGRRYAPVRVRSMDKVPFEIIGATAGPAFDVAIETPKSGPRGTQYAIYLTLRMDAPTGPFGTMLEVQTSSLDQPLLQIPVFGIVAEPIKVDPSIIYLRQDGTDVGRRRRVKIQASPKDELELTEIKCDNSAVSASVDREAIVRYRHLRFLDVTLSGKLPKGRHEAVLTVTTSVHKAERLEIPVIITVPDSRG